MAELVVISPSIHSPKKNDPDIENQEPISMRIEMVSKEIKSDDILNQLKVVYLLNRIYTDPHETKEVAEDLLLCPDFEFIQVASLIFKRPEDIAPVWSYFFCSCCCSCCWVKKKKKPTTNDEIELEHKLDSEYLQQQATILRAYLPKFKEEYRINSIADVLKCFRIPSWLFMFSLGIDFIQLLAYNSILSTALSESNNDDNSDNNYGFKILAIIFSSISLTMTALDNLSPILIVNDAKNYILKATTRARTCCYLCFMPSYSRVLMLFELTNFFILILTSVTVIPSQPDPLSIILNCTALFCISQIDDQIFKIWRLNLQNKYYIDSTHQEDVLIQQYRLREFSIFIVLLLLFLMIPLIGKG